MKVVDVKWRKVLKWLPRGKHLRYLWVDVLILILLGMETVMSGNRVRPLLSTMSFLLVHFDEQYATGY